MKVQEVMTAAPLAIDENATLEAALRMMDEHSIRHLPVVDRGRLLGIISNRDLLGRAGWRAVASVGEGGAGGRRSVKSVMNRDAVTVSPGDDVTAAADEMLRHSIGCLPVTKDGKLLGMLSEMDLLDLASAADGFSLALAAPIGSLVREPAVHVAPWSTLHQVDEVMHENGVYHVPVLDGDQIVGIVSDRDMRRAEGQRIDWDTAVHSIMTEEVVIVDAQQPIVEAAAAMNGMRIGAVVVTGKGGEVYVVRTSDVLKYVMEAL